MSDAASAAAKVMKGNALPAAGAVLLPRPNYYLTNRLKTPSEARQPAEHEANHRDVDERLTGRAQALIIFAEAAVLGFPPEKALGHPASGHNGSFLSGI